MNPRRRLPVIVLLIVSLIATGVTRQFAAARRSPERKLGGEVVSLRQFEQTILMRSVMKFSEA